MHRRTWILAVASTATAAVIAQRSSFANLNFDFPKTVSPEPFEIRVDQSFVDLTLRKVRGYRPSQSLFSNWTIEGPPDWATASLAEHWGKDYQWRAAEERINKFEHYATTVPGSRNYSAPIPLHFVHQRSNSSDATPVLLLHGWTSSHFEWSRVIGPLAHGDNKTFHVVAPDLPGYGFSPAPNQPNMGPREMGAAFDALMKQLGYETYGVISTDLGWVIGMWMASDFQDSLTGLFTDFYRVPPLPTDFARQTMNKTTKEESDFIEVSNAWDSSHAVYGKAQAQKPQALSVALTDSPVGFASWLWDLRYTISDDYQYSFDELITDTMLLWIQSPYGSMRSWLEFNTMLPKTDVPTGVAQWGNINGPFSSLANFPLIVSAVTPLYLLEIVLRQHQPRQWAERTSNIVYWKRHLFGGHYPFVTHPDLWIADVKEFFSSL
ncbi:uncharacterized protein CTRU02_209103 [Colletotrichum truncatum]|uniref:Uncharacterized protein n=1 Tax=Colletotrichum truncatum TaxID=5467 RepID=A0ACC3YZR3_COLTU